MAFAEEAPLPAYYADSVMYADSAAYYEGLSNQLKLEADALKKSSSRQFKYGLAAAAIGAVGTILVLNAVGDVSIEGGGAGVVFLVAPAEILMFGGMIAMCSAGIKRGKIDDLHKQSDAHLETSRQYQEKANKERYRRTSQMMLRVVPQVDPFHKAVGARLAFSL